MRAITCKTFGEPEVLTLSDIPKPTPNAEQLLVRVHATGVNRADTLQRHGKYAPPPGESDILGLEIAGVVEATGEQVTTYKIGDRVFGLVGSGAYAEYCVIDQHVAMPIPTDFTFKEAAATAEAFLTANEAIFTLGELQAGQKILIHAGASGVGSAGIQLAKSVGAIVYTTVGSAEKAEKLASLKPDAIINYKEQNFLDELAKLTNNSGVDVIVDFIGAKYLEDNLKSLNIGGRLICVGLMGGNKAELNMELILRRRLQIKGLVMRVRPLEDKRKMAQKFRERWLPLFAKKEIKPLIDSVFPLSDAKLAHERMERNENFGKIVLIME